MYLRMKKVSIRYKILILNFILTFLYWGFIQIWLNGFNKEPQEIVDYLNLIWEAYILVLCYNFIHIIWIAFIIFGVMKRRKEYLIGGVISILFSVLIFILILLNRN